MPDDAGAWQLPPLPFRPSTVFATSGRWRSASISSWVLVRYKLQFVKIRRYVKNVALLGFLGLGNRSSLDQPCSHGKSSAPIPLNSRLPEVALGGPCLALAICMLFVCPDSCNHPRRPPELAFGAVVIARGLLDGAMLRLLHGFGERNSAARGFGQIAGAQPMCAKHHRIEPGLGNAAF